MTSKKSLLSDQRKERLKDNQSPIAVVKPLAKAKACVESLSMCCKTCGNMVVSPHIHDGCECTISKCSEGHWKGGTGWNRLYAT